MLPLVGLARSDTSLSALDFAHLGVLTMMQNSACSGLAVPVSGMHRTDFSLLVLDFAHPELPLLMRSSACSGSLLPALDLLHLELTLPTRGFTRTGLILPAFGDLKFPNGYGSETLPVLGRVRFGSSLFVLDWVTFGLALSAKSSSCLDSTALALDFLRPGPSLLLQTFA